MFDTRKSFFKDIYKRIFRQFQDGQLTSGHHQSWQSSWEFGWRSTGSPGPSWLRMLVSSWRPRRWSLMPTVTSSDVWFVQAPSNKSAHSAHSMDWTSYHALEDIYGWSDFLFWGDNLHFVDQPFDLGLITLIRLLTSARRRLLGRPMKARTW